MEDDIKILAFHVAAHAIRFSEQGRNAYNECVYCQAHVYHDQDPDLIKHFDDCPLLIARKYLSK